MLIITDLISNVSDHLVLCEQQLYGSSFFEISLVLWASDDILSFQFAVYHYNTHVFFPPQNFNIRFSKSEIMSEFTYQQLQKEPQRLLVLV